MAGNITVMKAGTVIVGMQWGDEGKAKILDAMLEDERFDVVARYQGGANAGHTIWHNGKKHVCHLIPSGILHPDVTNVMGNGMVIHIPSLLKEVDEARAAGGDPDNKLMISSRATIVLDYHIKKDSEGSGVGSTAKGIGPAYTSVADRSAVKVQDILDDTALRAALERFRQKNPGADIEKDWLELREARPKIGHMVNDTAHYLYQQLRNNNSVLFEGAQATMLDKDHGTFPYVTSSNPTAGGACTGCGVGPTCIDDVVGIMKAYVTRVGRGPFPTELGGEKSAEHCEEKTHVLRFELDMFGIPYSLDEKDRPMYEPQDPKILDMLRSNDDFTKGVAMRLLGGEYGASTGRPRRCGNQDLVVANYAIEINGIRHVALTKLDVLDNHEEILVATAYTDPKTGETLDHMPDRRDVFERVEPVYKRLQYGPASEKVAGCTSWDKLPDRAKRYVEFMEKFMDRPIKYVSTAAERDCMIVR